MQLHDDEGLTIVIVEQQASFALGYTDRAYFLEKGEVRFEGPSAELARAQRPAAVGLPRRRDEGLPLVTEFFSFLVLGIIQGLTYGVVALGMVLIYKGTTHPELRPAVHGAVRRVPLLVPDRDAGLAADRLRTGPRDRAGVHQVARVPVAALPVRRRDEAAVRDRGGLVARC